MRPALVLLPCVLLALACPAAAAPDEELLGKSAGYPIGTLANWFFDERVRVGSFSNLDQILPHYTLAKAATPLPIPEAASAPKIEYSFENRTLALDDFLSHQRVTGFLLIKDGKLLAERYQYDRNSGNRFISHSMAKSIVSIAIGMALAEKKIGSLDDTVSKYVPQLAGNPYGETAIRNLLRMSSGVPFSEDYDGKDDLTRFVIARRESGSIEALRLFTTRETEQGARFHYASSETVVLTVLLRAVTGTTLSDYLTPRLWQPIGAEADASWARATDGTVPDWEVSMRPCAITDVSECCWPMTAWLAASRSCRGTICSMRPTGAGNRKRSRREGLHHISAMATSSGCFQARSADSRCSASTVSRSLSIPN